MSNVTPLAPHGWCDCDGPSCCGGRGPAAFEVVRDGRTMRVCTRCDLPGDRPTRKLLVTGYDKPEPWQSFDALGFLCILGMLHEGVRT